MLASLVSISVEPKNADINRKRFSRMISFPMNFMLTETSVETAELSQHNWVVLVQKSNAICTQ